MGVAVTRSRFDSSDFDLFGRKLKDNLVALGRLLSQPGFGEGEASLGSELEVFLVDGRAQPLPISEQLLGEVGDSRFTLELDRFNLECNAEPSRLAGRPITFFRDQLEGALARLRAVGQRHGARVVTVGILPTLAKRHLTREAMCDLPRYQALAEGLRLSRGAPFQFDIAGKDPLRMQWDHVTFEGANTSLQLHLRVPPARFSSFYNAIQMATAPALAGSGNSPTFLGHRLWEETRVALFKQAVDERPSHAPKAGLPRVCFGTGWIRGGALELFSEAVERHPPLIAQNEDECPLQVVESGKLPGLWELRLHASTVWRWNRPVYDPRGHLRIEMRALPSGPTVTDMLANTAFLVGLAYSLENSEAALQLPFERARANFYRAAQYGLGATLHWPVDGRVKELRASELLPALCTLAQEGLARAGVEADETASLLRTFAERAQSGRTGAAWQRSALAALRARAAPEQALEALTQRYIALSESGMPVHLWPD